MVQIRDERTVTFSDPVPALNF